MGSAKNLTDAKGFWGGSLGIFLTTPFRCLEIEWDALLGDQIIGWFDTAILIEFDISISKRNLHNLDILAYVSDSI